MIALGAALLAIFMGSALRLARADAAEPSDASLVAACATGDLVALGLLFDRLHHSVFRFLSRYLKQSPADLDDLVQATFLEVLRAAPSYRGGSSAQTWVLGIAANVGKSHVRGEVRRRAMLGRAALAPVGEAPRPDDQMERRRALRRLEARLPELPHDLRVPFLMCVIEDRPCAEVAQALGIPEGTLWRRLHEARTLLRDAVEGQRP